MKDEINIIIARIKDKYYYLRFLSALRDLTKVREKEDRERFGSKLERCIRDYFYGRGVGRK